MPNLEKENVSYSQQVIDFIAVGVEFSALLETDEPIGREAWVEKMLKLLPLLYLKASLFPKTEPVELNCPKPLLKKPTITAWKISFPASWAKKIHTSTPLSKI